VLGASFGERQTRTDRAEHARCIPNRRLSRGLGQQLRAEEVMRNEPFVAIVVTTVRHGPAQRGVAASGTLSF
jgi:hypothetical protein